MDWMATVEAVAEDLTAMAEGRAPKSTAKLRELADDLNAVLEAVR